MKHLFGLSKKNEDGSVTIPALLVDRWTRQMNTEYKDLSDAEKDSDRAEADRMIEIGVRAAECDHSAAGPKDSFCPKCLHHIG